MEMQWKQREGERTENKRRDGADGRKKKRRKTTLEKRERNQRLRLCPRQYQQD